MSIEKLGHQVANIWNIKDRQTKKPLPMYFVDLMPNPGNKIQFLLNCRVVVFEPPRAKRQIPQCATCQRYGHTKGYCFRKPRCVKCAGNHATANCHKKERSEHVKCSAVTTGLTTRAASYTKSSKKQSFLLSGRKSPCSRKQQQLKQ